jgi:hypothetical protein
MSLRIRQIVLAARDLASAVTQAQDSLGLRITYRDPEVAKFGLENALMSLGDQFLEIVSPTRADTAVGRHLDRHGDSAYMLILQTDDLERERARLTQLGVRIVWESNHPDIRAVHLHPKDIGAAIVSLDEATPPSSWRWGGPNWQREKRPSGRIVDATIATCEPTALAAHWAKVLGLEPPQAAGDTWRIAIEDGELNFAPQQDGTERIVAFGVQTSERAPSVTIGGTLFKQYRE